MSEPNGYLIHGTAYSSKEAAFKALVSNHEQESWFHKIWWEDAQPYYFEPQPQLTILKSIATLVDQLMWFEKQSCRILYKANSDSDWKKMNSNPEYHILYKWVTKNKWANMPLIAAYLNPLTRDLVKVVETDDQ